MHDQGIHVGLVRDVQQFRRAHSELYPGDIHRGGLHADTEYAVRRHPTERKVSVLSVTSDAEPHVYYTSFFPLRFPFCVDGTSPLDVIRIGLTLMSRLSAIESIACVAKKLLRASVLHST
jgi:hypothetical protein